MTERRVQLGDLVLSYNRSSLQLFLAVAATVSVPSQASASLDIPDDQILTILTSTSSWATRGAGFRLVFHVVTNGHPKDLEAVASFGEMLSAAECWNQLGLQARFVGCRDTSIGPDSSSQYSFHVEVSHIRDYGELDIPNVHRLLSGVPVTDIKPPPAIPVLPLHAIHYTVGITNDMKSQSNQDVRDVYTRPDCVAASSEALCDGTDLDEEEILVDIEPAEHQFIEDASLTHFDTIQSSEASSYQRPPLELDQHLESPVRDENFSLQVQGLLDAAFRLSICDKPQKLMKGVRVKTADLETHLAAVSPSLFSPGHSKAVAQRSCFIPTIAHALSKKLPQSARSESLKRKLERLGRPPHGCQELDNGGRARPDVQEDSLPSTAERYHSVSARLWQFLQTSLYDERAARRLKPILGASSICTDMNEELFEVDREVLDGFVDQPDECNLDFVDEDDNDLFEDSLLESDDSIEADFNFALDTASDEGDSCDDLFDASVSQQPEGMEHKLTSLFDTTPTDATLHCLNNSTPSTENLFDAPPLRLNSIDSQTQSQSPHLFCEEILPAVDVSTLERVPSPFSMFSEPHCRTTAPRRLVARPCTRYEHEDIFMGGNPYADMAFCSMDSYPAGTEIGTHEEINVISGEDADEEMMDAGDENGEHDEDEIYSSGNESGVMLEEDEGYAGFQETSCPWVNMD